MVFHEAEELMTEETIESEEMEFVKDNRQIDSVLQIIGEDYSKIRRITGLSQSLQFIMRSFDKFRNKRTPSQQSLLASAITSAKTGGQIQQIYNRNTTTYWISQQEAGWRRVNEMVIHIFANSSLIAASCPGKTVYEELYWNILCIPE